MPFYKVLSGFCTKDKVTETPHPYGTTDGWEESLAGTLLEEEVQKGHRTMGQLGVQEQVPRGRKTRGQLLELAHEDSSIGDVPCIIIRCPTGDQSVCLSASCQSSVITNTSTALSRVCWFGSMGRGAKLRQEQCSTASLTPNWRLIQTNDVEFLAFRGLRSPNLKTASLTVFKCTCKLTQQLHMGERHQLRTGMHHQGHHQSWPGPSVCARSGSGGSRTRPCC
ncbi:hypothetical protein Y1Q_0010695 [Alligator mississippiensis]|uniref:Uncharacterized protein n=1 Tax=Alligator mississippiensis TaxID=8496 RepID=A0A151M6I2_ALLMI|nr:hypothetical protein Y1Q_0010695 [Alligator mississippiensis]